MLPASGAIHIQDVDNKCQPATRLCSPVLLNNPILYAGGTAYDPRHQSAWVSDGRALVEVDLKTCKTICQPKPSIMRQNAVFSGLALARKRGMLYHLETEPGYLGILPWSNRTCPPIPTKGGCFMQLGKLDTAAGLAYDEVRDLLYYTVSTPGVTGPINTLYVASPTSGCQPLCKVTLPVCGTSLLFGKVTGLAYNPCTSTLYATDGQATMRLQMLDPRKCSIRLLGCCAKTTGGGLYQGLALIPGWTQTNVGKGCINKGCPFCTNLQTVLVGGDPTLGNPDFAIEIRNGPAGSPVTLGIGVGNCTGGMPFLCGNLYLPLTPPPILIPMGKLAGSQCQTSVRLGVPIPVDPKLCGVKVCLQSVAMCGSGGLAYALSPGLQFTLVP
ncbi:MAG: hypothetical protein ACYTF5_01510 [Planctomycetota bacterium]|jgi:hypothetical protein